jgi:acyl-CoA synthetase (NDP forming)
MPFKVPELKPVIDTQRKPIVFYSYTLPSQYARTGLTEAGAVVLSGLTHVAVAIRQLVQRAKFKLAAPAAVASPAGKNLASRIRSTTLSEYDSKQLLRDAGVSTPDEILVTERGALSDAIKRAGFPLVMKIQSRDIPHKSEVGGVRVNIASETEASAAYDRLLANARRHRPDAAIQGVLVGPMAKKGVEMIVGTVQDATFGPVIMVGLGGVTTELFKDVVYRPVPVGEAEAASMLQELKAWPLLNGFRGAPLADVSALAKLVAQISQLAAQLRDDVSDIEINPVLVHPQGEGVTVVDALVVPASRKGSA